MEPGRDLETQFQAGMDEGLAQRPAALAVAAPIEPVDRVEILVAADARIGGAYALLACFGDRRLDAVGGARVGLHDIELVARAGTPREHCRQFAVGLELG